MNLVMTTVVNIMRGKSIWVFENPNADFNKFMLNLYWACIYDNIAPNYDSTIHAWKTINSQKFSIWEEIFQSSAELTFSKNKIHFQTFWSGYDYYLMPSQNGGIRIEFYGPRAAFGAQTLMPRQIANFLDWRYCVGMWDAKNEWFYFSEVLNFYRKVDGEHLFWDFLHLKEESQPTITTNKGSRHSNEGTLNFEKWDNGYCSHYSKGTTLRSHRNKKAIKTSGHLVKGAPEWWWKRAGYYRK